MSKKSKNQDTDADDKTTLFLEEIPAQIKADFKAACASRQISMRDAFIHLMQEFVCNGSGK